MSHVIKDANAANQTFKSTPDTGELVPHVKVDSLPSGLSTEAKQDTLNAKDFATQTTLAALLAKIIAAPATEAKQDTLNSKDFATQTTLAALLAKVIAAPATEAKQDTLNAKDFATQTTLAALLAKIIAAPATEAKQDTLNSKDFATQTTLAALLAKVIAAPATEAKQDTLNAKDFATEATLAQLIASLYTHDSAAVATPKGLILMGVRRDSDSSPAQDGDNTYLILNETGRLKVAGAPAQFNPVTGTITANAQTVFAKVDQVSNVMMHCFGTFSTVNVTFEGSLNSTNGSDGNWFTIQAIRSNANTIETTSGNLSAAPAYAWELSVNALAYVRVRATAFTSGTQNWVFTLGSYATEPIPGAQVSGTQPVSGTVTVSSTTANEGTLATPTPSNINSAATTNPTSVKASAGTVYSITASNVNAAVRYLKLYNKASAPTVGTDVPVMVIPIPAGGFVNVVLGKTGHRFATGIALAITTAMADSDTGAVAANEIKATVSYI